MADISLEVTRVFDTTPDDLFDAFINPERVAKWYGPGPADSDIHEYDATEGGSYSLTMHGMDGKEYKLRGTFKTIDKPHKIAYTWVWEGASDTDGMGKDETLITVEFKPVGDKTEMHFRHEGFATEALRDNHNKGWEGCFAKLEKVVSK